MWIPILFTVLLFSACTTQPEEESYGEEYLDSDQVQVVEIEGVTRKIMPHGLLTIEHFLEDLDYLVYVLENNFALLDVAYWAHGIDYRELAEKARRLIAAMEEPDEDVFLAIMSYSFLPLRYTGHFRIHSIPTYRELIAGSPFAITPYHIDPVNFELLRSPLALRFYGSVSRERQDRADTTFTTLIETYGVSNRFFNSPDSPPLPVPESVTTEIIIEDRIAYISSGSTTEELSQAQSQIFDFYSQITDYEHLILDLRGNRGGLLDVFLDVLIRPHLEIAIESPQAYLFFLDGPYIRRFGDPADFLTMRPSGNVIAITEPYRLADKVLEAYNLPEFNHTDIERLHYGAPADRGRPIEPHLTFNREYAFNGKVWLLTNHIMGSASQLAARTVKETGFATLVGDVTGGNFGGSRTMALMPNTGIAFQFDMFYITDSRGRPLEAGTIPHHFNRPGMDALETVLALIAEGEY